MVENVRWVALNYYTYCFKDLSCLSCFTLQLLEAGQFGKNFLVFPRGSPFVGVKFYCRTIVCMLQHDWSVYEKGRHPLFSINVLIGYFSSNRPPSSSCTVMIFNHSELRPI